jgi:predicted nucleic acid-binding protein
VRTWVVDASVAVKSLVLEDLSDLARELSGTRSISSPRLIVTEIANALVRKMMQGMLTAHEARNHFAGLPVFLPDLIDVDDLIEPALKNACALRRPIYDLIYFEVARRLDVQLVTADRRFVAKLVGTDFARHVTLLSHWQPA